MRRAEVLVPGNGGEGEDFRRTVWLLAQEHELPPEQQARTETARRGGTDRDLRGVPGLRQRICLRLEEDAGRRRLSSAALQPLAD